MNEVLKLSASGKISIYIINNGVKQLYLTSSNLIMPLAADIIARSLGNFAIGKVNYIRVYNGVTLKAAASISVYNHPATNEVEYVAVFSEASFSGAFTKFQLEANGMGVFSEVTGLTGSKLITEQMSISWKITISIV